MKNLKRIIALVSCMTIILGMAIGSNAASQDSWDVYYIPYSSSTISNQQDYAYVSYYADGFYGRCDHITGSNGRGLTISSSSAGGMNSVNITTTGKTSSWKMKKSATGNCKFKVSAFSGYFCDADGIIHINN